MVKGKAIVVVWECGNNQRPPINRKGEGVQPPSPFILTFYNHFDMYLKYQSFGITEVIVKDIYNEV
jgi:hypothetical protein